MRELSLAGYFAKTTALPKDCWTPPHVTEICSVSTCLTTPVDWISKWRHNELGFFNTPADARVEGFSLFAYRILPRVFRKEGAESLELPPLPVEPLGANWVSLGFDAVSRSLSAFFECSPLSCNGMAREIAVNRFCLIDTLDAAIAAAQRFAIEQPEPGEYYVLEVLRQKSL